MTQKALGLWRTTSYAAGGMIASGIFLLPASIAPYGSIGLAGWGITTFGAITIALTFAWLARVAPRAGGPYAYTRIGFGDYPAFLVAWGYWIAIWTGNAAIATALVGYLTVFLPGLADPVRAAVTAVVIVWLLSWVNLLGVRTGGSVQVVTTVLKLIPLALIAFVAIWFVEPANFEPLVRPPHTPMASITATAALTLWAFVGVEAATIPAGDVVDPARTIPRATIIAVLIAASVYVLGSVAVMGLIPSETLMSSPAPFADAARVLWGEWAARGVALGAVISCLGALNCWILFQGQIPAALADDALLPRVFARRNAHDVPWPGLIAGSALMSILVALNYTGGLVEAYNFLILLSTLATLVPYLACTLAALLPLRFDRTVPTAPIAVRLIALLAFVYSVWATIGTGWEVIGWGFALILGGTPIYWHVRSTAGKRKASGVA